MNAAGPDDTGAPGVAIYDTTLRDRTQRGQLPGVRRQAPAHPPVKGHRDEGNDRPLAG